MISKISGMRQAQLQNSFVSDNNDLSQWQYIIFSDAENMNKFKGIMFKKLYIKDFCMKYSRNDLCFCGSGKKYKNCHSDINPNSLVAHQYRIMHLLDEEIKNCPYTICQKGCSDCCTDDFEVSVTEFFTILNYLQIHCNNQQIENICKLSKVKISSSNGKVIFAGLDPKIVSNECQFNERYGNEVEILNEDGNRCIYGHLSKVLVKAGDMLVVVLVYSFVRIFLPTGIPRMPFYVFLFACFVEVLQYFQLVETLGITNRVARIVLGSTFDWGDIVCYAVGCVFIVLFEHFVRRRS